MQRVVEYEKGDFPVDVSVVIPVYNRVRSIADAVRSAVAQQGDFSYNIIVVRQPFDRRYHFDSASVGRRGFRSCCT